MFWKRSRSDEDFSAEIQAHLEMEADRLVEEGVNRQEASGAAQRAFGNVTGAREQFYESSRWMWLDRLVRDIRYAARQIRRSPVATATIVLSLALGIGATTALFSLADQALLRTLPVEEPERLVQLDWHGLFVGSGTGSVGSGSLVPYLLYRDLRERNDVFEDLFARSPVDVHLSFGKESEPVTVEIVTGSYFPTLGVRPALGRLLVDADDLEPDAHPVVVLSNDYWRSRLGADATVVGKQVRVNGFPMTVVGVAEPGFHGMDWGTAPALWVPVMMKGRVTPGWNGLFERQTRFLHAFGRLKPGISREQAEARLQPWFRVYLRAAAEREGWPGATDEQMRQYLASRLALRPGARGPSDTRSQIDQPVLILLVASALILLLACLNVAGLSLARALSRRRATAMRVALGASRRRIVTEQLVESAVLAAAGCLVGAALAPSLSRTVLSFLPSQGAASAGLSADLDVRVLSFTLAITALTTILCGSAPALYAASIRPLEALKERSSSVVGGLGLRKAFVVGQFSLALILLIGAGLFARTLGTLRARGAGFPTANLLMFRVDPLSDGYGVAESKPLIRRLLTALQELPEVESAGVGRWEILTAGGWNNPLTVESNQRIVTGDTAMNAVSPGFFQALGVSVAGRDFDERDSRDDSEWGLRSAIVNEEFVKRYFKDRDPLGVRLGMGDKPDTSADLEIVGVVKTFHDVDLREPEAQVFFPLWERSVEEGTFYVRSRRPSREAARSIRNAVAQIDPRLVVLSFRTIDDQLDRMLTNERMLTTLAGAFAGVATLLAMIGLYGVLVFTAESRTREIGVRLALGAKRWEAGGLIVREAALLAVAGLAIAIPAAWALGHLIETQLFGVHALDATTIVGAGAVLALVCLVASAVPVWKAGSVSPWEALRSD